MALCPLDSVLWGDLYGDAEVARQFTDAAELAAMVRVEAVLAQVQGRLGVIPAEAGTRIAAALDGLVVPPEALADGTAAAGVPPPALVAYLRGVVGGEAAGWIHWGPTSQDIVDLGFMLRLKAALETLAARLDALIPSLAAQANAHARTVMAGRTRSQIATPITFGLRIAQWTAPLIALRGRLDPLRARVLRVQFGGASGANTAIAPHGPAVADALAAALGLAPSPPWGTDRAGLAQLAAWLAQTTGALGKMAGDLMIMGRSEIAEAQAGAGGGSSTMPQKSNPVAAEAMVALARYLSALVGPMHLAQLHQEERDATAWALEWFALPQMVVATGAALRHGQNLAATLSADAARMAEMLKADGGGVFAEQATFALAAYMPRPQAADLLKRAMAQARAEGRTLADVLPSLTDAPVDWEARLGTEGVGDAAVALIAQILRHGSVGKN